MQPFDFSSIFAAAPNPYLLLSAEAPYTILGANDAYLAATLTTREQLVGRGIFDAFPDNPADPTATGVRNLRTSLEHVVSCRESHIMAVQKYDIRRPDGAFEERYWSPKNSPVLRADGTVAYIIHWVEDVTELVRLNVLAGEKVRQAVELQGHYERREAAITLREEELTERLLAHHERERLSEERRRAEARTREILESITDAFLAVDADWRFTYFNPQAEKVLGRPADDMLGKVIWDEYPGLTGGEFEQMYRRVVAERVAGSATAFYPDHNRWYEIRAYPGVGGGLSIYFRDVTERVTAEEALRASERRLRAFFESDMVGTFYWDTSGRVSDTNDRFLQIVGYDRGDVAAGRVLWAEMTPPEYRHLDERSIAECLSTGVCAPFEKEFVRKDGSRVPVIVGGAMVDERRNEGVGFVLDITERRRADAALRESEERFRLLAEALPQMVWTAQPDGSVDYFNRKWYQYTGNTEGIGGDASWIPAFDAETGERVREAWYRAVRTGEPYELEYPLRRAADGKDRWHLARALPLRDAAGRVVRWFGTITDIHDQKEAQARIEQLLGSERAARDEAERASRMKDEFLATLSHELRTPLNAILGWSQILSSGTRDEEDLRDGLQTIERNARAQTKIIEDLLDMSRIISGKVRLDVQRVDLADVVKEAVATAKLSADAKGIRLQVVLDPHAGPVSGDPERLQQVMWNLLSNAVKFTPKGGRVQVLLERVNSHVEVSVIDTGEGIKPDFLPHVFDRFRQADGGTTRRHGGLGLGLSIVKQLIEMHGGSVRVKSPGEGGGATFAVSLPLTAVHPEPDPHVARHHPRVSTSNKGLVETCPQISGVKVLVVDDEPDARALVRRLLEDCEAQVLTAGSATEAVNLIRAERPDVMVCDIGMPGEDGYSLIRRLRALAPEHGGQVPAAALTAYARAEDRVKAVLAGFQMHLAKPVEPAELIATVAALARRTGNAKV